MMLAATDPQTNAIAILIIGGAIYFIPAMVARNRNHPSSSGIFVLNLFLGWTLLGWVLALVWASSGPAGSGRNDSGPINVTPPPANLLPSISMDKWPDPPPSRTRAARAFACPDCDGAVKEGANYCSHCGAALAWD